MRRLIQGTATVSPETALIIGTEAMQGAGGLAGGERPA